MICGVLAWGLTVFGFLEFGLGWWLCWYGCVSWELPLRVGLLGYVLGGFVDLGTGLGCDFGFCGFVFWFSFGFWFWVLRSDYVWLCWVVGCGCDALWCAFRCRLFSSDLVVVRGWRVYSCRVACCVGRLCLLACGFCGWRLGFV